MGRRIEKGNVRLKRAYESPSAEDGTGVLVDRLWPRGVRKEDAAIDHWAKDLSPSTTYGNGSDMIPPAGTSFASATALNSVNMTRHLNECASLREKDELLSSTRLMTNRTAVVIRDLLLE